MRSLFAAILSVCGFLPLTASAQESECQVKMAQYLALQDGMSQSQVEAILGCPGVELSRSDIGGMTTIMYMWNGTTFMANMNVMLQGDRLVSRAQMGLE